MSQPALPDAATARRVLTEGVYGRAVLQAMQARGYPAATEKEAYDLLDLAGRVKAMAPPVKTAGDVYEAALAALDGRRPSAAADDTRLQKAAAALAADPAVYASVLALRAEALGGPSS
jgi:hypothetical protein